MILKKCVYLSLYKLHISYGFVYLCTLFKGSNKATQRIIVASLQHWKYQKLLVDSSMPSSDPSMVIRQPIEKRFTTGANKKNTNQTINSSRRVRVHHEKLGSVVAHILFSNILH